MPYMAISLQRVIRSISFLIVG